MNDISYIVPGLERCDRKCRNCGWRDGFSGVCMLTGRAAEYIKRLEHDNAEKVVYCKDCIYCEVEVRTYKYHGKDQYTCKHRDGLSVIELNPMDYCSRGKARRVADENA